LRTYLAAWGDREAYAVSHVGWGMNPGARYEALTMYDKNDTIGTELRAVAGNFCLHRRQRISPDAYTADFRPADDGYDDRLDGVAFDTRRRSADVFRLILA